MASTSPAGTVIGWGSKMDRLPDGTPYAGHSTGAVMIADQFLTNAIAVAAGMRHGLALRTDGTVVGWGLNGRGQATGSPSANSAFAAGVVEINRMPLSNVVSIAAGWIHSLALLKDGRIAGWGTRFDGEPIVAPSSVSNVISVAGWWSLAARSDGTVVNILTGQTYPGISNIVAVAAPRADYGDLVALRKDGVVLEIRLASPPSMSMVASNATAIATGRWQHLALQKDGTVFAWGSHSNVPPGLSNVVAISAGEYHSLALKRDGTVVAWGATDRPSAQVPAGLSNVVAIAAGNDFSLAITTNPAVAARFMQEVR